MESRSGERFGEYSIPGFDNFPRLVRFVGEGERERERQREREREKRGSKRGKSHGCWRRINRRADVNRTLDSVFADRANATVAGGEISLARSLSLSLSLWSKKERKKGKKTKKGKKNSTVPSSGSHSSVLKRDSMSISGHTSHTWSMMAIRADGCSQLFHARIERGTLFRLKDNALFPPLPRREQCTHVKIE